MNENGSYNIALHANDNKVGDELQKPAYDTTNRIYDVTNGTVTKGVATISGDGNINRFVATDSTVYMLRNSDGYTYTVYTGKNNVPSVRNAELCIKTDGNGYATLVVIKGTLSANTFYAYVTENEMNGRFYSDTKGWQYTVYKVGELTTTTIWGNEDSLDDMLKEGKGHSTGLYKFVVNSNSQIESVEAVLCDLHCPSSWTNVSGWDRSAVKAAISGNSFQTFEYANRELNKDNDNGYTVSGTSNAIRDYNVTDETKYIVVTKSSFTSDASLKEGSYADLLDGSIVLVNYSQAATDNTGILKLTAKTVYILKVVQDDINTPTVAPSISTAIDLEYTDLTVTVKNGTPSKVNSTTVVYISIQKDNGAWSTPVMVELEEGQTMNVADGGSNDFELALGINGSGTYKVAITAETTFGNVSDGYWTEEIASKTITIVK